MQEIDSTNSTLLPCLVLEEKIWKKKPMLRLQSLHRSLSRRFTGL